MGRRWYYSHDGTQRFGPVSTSRLKELARSGDLQPVSMVLLEGGRRWVKAATVKGLFPGTDAETTAPDASPAPEAEAPAEKRGSAVVTACLTIVTLLVLSGLLAGGVYYAMSLPRRVAVTSTAPAGPTAPARAENADEPPDPELFENPPQNFRTLPKTKQAELQRQAEATYLDPSARDEQHIAAANVLLGLSEGHTSLLKGLDVYDREETRRRYRWCLHYLAVAQVMLDMIRPPRPGEASGIIPAKHVAAMVEFLRPLDPAKPSDGAQWADTLNYLEVHPEHAGPVVPVLRELRRRHDGNAKAAQQLRSAIAAAEKKG
jgi:hypothetical protein